MTLKTFPELYFVPEKSSWFGEWFQVEHSPHAYMLVSPWEMHSDGTFYGYVLATSWDQIRSGKIYFFSPMLRENYYFIRELFRGEYLDGIR